MVLCIDLMRIYHEFLIDSCDIYYPYVYGCLMHWHWSHFMSIQVMLTTMCKTDRHKHNKRSIRVHNSRDVLSFPQSFVNTKWTVSRFDIKMSSYLHNGISYTDKTSSFLIRVVVTSHNWWFPSFASLLHSCMLLARKRTLNVYVHVKDSRQSIIRFKSVAVVLQNIS